MNPKETGRNTDHAQPRTPADDRREVVENDRDSVANEGNSRAVGGHHTEELPRSKKGGRVRNTDRPDKQPRH
jgi:hypothetical protein